MSTESSNANTSRDSLAIAYCDIEHHPDFEPATMLAFKAGWDARDEELLKLHGEGAMADVIRSQQEVSKLHLEALKDTERIGFLQLENKRLEIAIETQTHNLNVMNEEWKKMREALQYIADTQCPHFAEIKCTCVRDTARLALKNASPAVSHE